MQKLLLLFLFFLSTAHAFKFKVASYNVENLFDLHHDKSEYKEYIPNTYSKWNKKNQTIKLQNSAQVISQMDADIIALQEIESQTALNELLEYLPQYPYSAFVKNKNSSIGLAIISKFKITQNQLLFVQNSKVNRGIQKVTVNIHNHTLLLFNNHWASKRHKESRRINFALHLQDEVKTYANDLDYILLGDFNSNYNEHETLRLEKRLNDSNALTGINHVLNTTINEEYINKKTVLEYKQTVHYNLWAELAFNKRFSSKYKGANTTPDHILLPPALFDKKGISYINNSFKVFKPYYLYNNNKIKRWKINQKTKQHLGKGYSDHLPIMASFSISPYLKKDTSKTVPDNYTIKHLYQEDFISKPLLLKDVQVIYKTNNHAIIKNKHGRAVFLYNCAQSLKLGFSYDIKVFKIKEHYGLKEIIQLQLQKEFAYDKNFSKNHINANTINLHDTKYQNEVITNLVAFYKNGYLYYKDKKIKLYAKDKTLLPKNGQNITIISGHLGFFKNKAQIIIYKKSDIRVN